MPMLGSQPLPFWKELGTKHKHLDAKGLNAISLWLPVNEHSQHCNDINIKGEITNRNLETRFVLNLSSHVKVQPDQPYS